MGGAQRRDPSVPSDDTYLDGSIKGVLPGFPASDIQRMVIGRALAGG